MAVIERASGAVVRFDSGNGLILRLLQPALLQYTVAICLLYIYSVLVNACIDSECPSLSYKPLNSPVHQCTMFSPRHSPLGGPLSAEHRHSIYQDVSQCLKLQ